MREKEEYVEVDILQMVKALWKRAWVIILSMVVCGAAVFAITKFLITPQYSSRILMYVNNNNTNEIQQSISQADLAAAQKLVDTYKVILKSQSTLDEVIAKAGLPYTAEELNNMIKAASVNSTEVFYVEVTRPDPKEAAKIANTIGMVLPERISAIVDGSSVRLVDYAQIATKPSSPNVMRNTAMGALLGMLVSCVTIVVRQLTNDKISGPDYLTQNYEIPVLAVIPDLVVTHGSSGYYQSGYGRTGKGQ